MNVVIVPKLSDNIQGDVEFVVYRADSYDVLQVFVNNYQGAYTWCLVHRHTIVDHQHNPLYGTDSR